MGYLKSILTAAEELEIINTDEDCLTVLLFLLSCPNSKLIVGSSGGEETTLSVRGINKTKRELFFVCEFQTGDRIDSELLSQGKAISFLKTRRRFINAFVFDRHEHTAWLRCKAQGLRTLDK